MKKQNIPSTITLKNNKVVAHHISDGSELIPAEIQANTREEINQYLLPSHYLLHLLSARRKPS